MSEEGAIEAGRSARYRAASEALHSDQGIIGHRAANLRMLWACGYADLIRADFYGLLELADDVRGSLLDTGCGTGLETANLQRRFPGLAVAGIDISGVALAGAVARPENRAIAFYQ